MRFQGPTYPDEDGDEGDPGVEIDMGTAAHLGEDGQPRVVERVLEVGPDEGGMRVDLFLKKRIPRLSRNKLQAIAREILFRNDQPPPIKASTLVAPGDVFVIRRRAQPEPPCPRTFDRLHEDERVLVVGKPAGLPVHSSAKFYFNTLTRVLDEHYPGQSLHLCHRLDRETSGCLVVARDSEAARIVMTAFARKRVRKIYQAIVHGVPSWERYTARGSLGLIHGRGELNVRMEVREHDSLPAITELRVLDRAGDYALIECAPLTGRQHQIRAHLAHLGHPIVGDKLYAHGDDAFRAYCDEGLTDELAELFVLPRQALHAAQITFPHPQTREPLTVAAPLPADLDGFLRKARR